MQILGIPAQRQFRHAHSDARKPIHLALARNPRVKRNRV